MLIIQQNCGKEYESIISTLNADLSFDAEIIYNQEPFLEPKNLAYLGFNLYWPARTHNYKDN